MIAVGQAYPIYLGISHSPRAVVLKNNNKAMEAVKGCATEDGKINTDSRRV